MGLRETQTAWRFGRVGRTAALLAFCAATLAPVGCRKAPPATLSAARAALASGDYRRAERLATAISAIGSETEAALAVAGEAAAKDRRVDDAIGHYRALASSQDRSGEAPLGWFYAGEVCLDAGRLSVAESCYQSFLQAVPDNAATHERMAFLTSVTGRRWESIPHYMFLVRSGSAKLQELVLFGDLDRPIEQRPFLEKCQRTAPGDSLVELGLAAHAVWEGQTADGLRRLREVVRKAPDSAAAQILLGELLVNSPDGEFVIWHKGLPLHAEDHPDLHYVRGLRARRQSRPQMAARCFWEAIRRAPTHRRATFQLGQVLRSLNHPASDAVEARSRQLIELTQQFDRILRTESRVDEPFRKTCLLLEQMGRIWEAGAWGVVARKQFPGAEWPSELFSRISARLNDQLPLVVESEDLSRKIDVSDFPPFELEQIETHDGPPKGPSAESSEIRFLEADHGPDFSYWNGADPQTRGARQFEQTGGGAGVLDFDADGWPDLFLPQGLDWKTGSVTPEVSNRHSDGLFRNRGGECWNDVTAAAGLQDTGFGQGCAAGDFDNDGFADLYVANVGRNQLLRNNGDGTYSDATAAAGLTLEDWTTSCAIVDLNGDGMPDLVDVNYLTGPQVYEMICQGHACSPSAFPGAEDRLYLSRGDGTFERSPPATPEVDGKGLGLLALAIDRPNRPSLFVANDQVPNFLHRNLSTAGGQRVEFADEAFVSGVAFNQDGLAMASMGIAADDADGDGRLDFYVTTFKDEGSMLFLQTSPGLFVESANTAGLRGPTWPFVGWGTQFLDADLDGWPDLVGVNGHVDDYRDEGGEYHMRPQFFRNLGGARFAELQGTEVGPFFGRPRLGRGLARLDWNRDGRMDFAVSHIGDRAALVTNDTANVGHFLNVRLSARTTARDAIGVTVEVVAGERRWTKQLVTGDGYMASNERLLQFGLGPAAAVSQVKVHWPSGAASVVRDIPANRTLELIEQSPRGILRESPERSTLIETVAGHGE